MKLYIKEYCVRCGLCEDLYPELFHLNTERDEIEIKYEAIPAEFEEMAKEAMRDCAIAAIFVER
jgi:ferredoxin